MPDLSNESVRQAVGGPGPTRDELQAELLEIPEPLDPPPLPDPPGTEAIIAAALSYVRGKRGADLVAVILVGSGARRVLTPHSDLNLIALVKGQEEGDEVVRVSTRLVEIRYRSHKLVEQELAHAARLPPLLRKGRVLFEHEQIGTKLVDKAGQRFRQGPPPVGLNERIRLKAHCLHALGKAEDLLNQPATAQYLLDRFLDDLLQIVFRLKGFWLTAPSDMIRFITSRDPQLGEKLDRFLTVPSATDRVHAGRTLIELVFRDIPAPPRID